MMPDDDGVEWAEPATLAELNLPPSFVSEHGLRTLSYGGSMSAADIARRWRVRDTVVVEVIDALKADGLVQSEATQANLDQLGRVRLSELGRARVPAARERTWYSGALPVSLDDFRRRMEVRARTQPFCQKDAVRAEFAPLSIEPALADAIGQAVAGCATLALEGAADDEHLDVARALGRALSGDVMLPHALYAAGSVVRVFDTRYHRTGPARGDGDAHLDILRSHDRISQWTKVARPVVTLAGGVLASDVLPAYDDEAKFYVAPAPLAASGGVLAVMDGGASPAGLIDLAKLWLTPGREGSGVMLLRSGERIEVPWRASTVIFCRAFSTMPGVLADALQYRVDISALADGPLRAFIAGRMADRDLFPEAALDAVTDVLERCKLATRSAAARTARYLRDRAAYDGSSFHLTAKVLNEAIDAGMRARPSGGATGLHAA